MIAWTSVASRRVSSAKIDSLTGLRFIAAIGVVFSHYEGFFNIDGSHWLFALGGLSVTLFFILSGFVLTIQYTRGAGEEKYFPIREYVLARVTRIFPLYWLMLLVTLAAYLATDFNISLGGGPETPRKVCSFFVNAFALQAWVPDISTQQFWNAPGWSVSSEVFFYLLLPCFLRAFAKLHSNTAIISCIALNWLINWAYFFVLRHFDISNQIWTLYALRLPILSLPAFALGVLLANRYIQNTSRNTVLSMPMLPILALLICASEFLGLDSNLNDSFQTKQLIWVPLFGWLIYSLTNKATILYAVFSSKLLILLGNSSFALYLMHWLPLGLLQRILGIDRNAPLTAMVVIFGMILTSVALHLLFEAPIRRAAVGRV